MNRIFKYLVPLGVLIIGTGAGVYFWRHIAQVHRVIASSIPPRPDLTKSNPELVRLIAASEETAREGPDVREGLGELSELYQANGYYPEAIQCFRGLLEIDPRNPVWPHRWASLLATYGELNDAIILWRRAERLAPDYLPIRIHLADALSKENQTTAAKAECEEVRKRDPGNPYAALGLARLAINQGNWSEAKTLLEATVQGNFFAIGSDLLVTTYDHLGMKTEADALRAQGKASGAFFDVSDPWIEAIYDLCFDPYRLSVLAGMADLHHAPATARKFLERAKRYAPNDGQIEFQLGEHFAGQQDFARAESYFLRTTQLLPDFADGWTHLADVYVHLHDSAAVRRTIEAGLSHCPLSPSLHQLRGRNFVSMGKRLEAIPEFLEAIRLRPEAAEARFDLASDYVSLGKVSQGIEMLNAALAAEPGYPPALATLALYWINSGNETEAVQALQKVRQQPRIVPAKARELEAAFQLQFGHTPP